MTTPDDVKGTPAPERESQPKPFSLRRFLFGSPKDIGAPGIFHRLSLIPVLAWVGLGADPLSSSCYGPEEAYRAVDPHTYLTFALAVAVVLTVCLIAAAYSRVIEHFPHGGGGYIVASKLLGPRWGVISGSALLIDYVLTISVSIAAAADALFSLAPLEWHFLKLPIAFVSIIALMLLNIRGVKESVLTLAPIFLLFVLCHALLIGYGIISHASTLPEVISQSNATAKTDINTIGLWAMIAIFFHAFSLGGGTFTGIEAVSNGMPILREPKIQTGRRTMLYIAVSLSLTAAGLLVCYLLWGITPIEGKTMNASLAERVAAGFPGANIFVLLTMVSAGALLFVAAQAGFIDGPRVLSNMAHDRWAPSQFANLSERLTTMNGIVLMGGAAALTLIGTRGNTHHLILMYSINIFLTFSLTMIGMLKFWVKRHWKKEWIARSVLFGTGALVCITILVVTVKEKFLEGGWITLASTGLLVTFFMLIRRHYTQTGSQLGELDEIKKAFPEQAEKPEIPPLDPDAATAAILVGGYTGLGLHTLLSVQRTFPNHFKNVLFLSVGMVDTTEMQSPDHIRLLRWRTDHDLEMYVEAAAWLGFASAGRSRLGTDVVEEALALCHEVANEFGKITFFSGQLIFEEESWFHRFLHNKTAFSIQRQLIWEGRTMVVLPIRVAKQ